MGVHLDLENMGTELQITDNTGLRRTNTWTTDSLAVFTSAARRECLRTADYRHTVIISTPRNRILWCLGSVRSHAANMHMVTPSHIFRSYASPKMWRHTLQQCFSRPLWLIPLPPIHLTSGRILQGFFFYQQSALIWQNSQNQTIWSSESWIQTSFIRPNWMISFPVSSNSSIRLRGTSSS